LVCLDEVVLQNVAFFFGDALTERQFAQNCDFVAHVGEASGF
jgi:hypothetical protein